MDSREELDRWDLAGWGAPSELDHAASLRQDSSQITRLWHDPSSRLLELDSTGRFQTEPFGQPIDHSRTQEPGEDTIFLGLVHGIAWFTRRGRSIGDKTTTASLRDVHLTTAQRQIVGSAEAVLNWYRINRHCVVCGGSLVRIKGGFTAVCTQCERETFPRTDPAVICAVLDQKDRLFLAHNQNWEAGRVSILAGFIEAGESAEQAVHREISEEANLRLGPLRYLGSQPWPLPRSLMFSYVARSTDGGLVDGDELEWGGWYTRDQVRTQIDAGELILPAGASVSRTLIDGWLAGTLPTPEQ